MKREKERNGAEFSVEFSNSASTPARIVSYEQTDERDSFDSFPFVHIIRMYTIAKRKKKHTQFFYRE